MRSHELAARVSLTTTRLARRLRQQDKGELTLTLRAALATIERRGPLTHGELAEAEQIAPATVTKVVGQLGDRGLIVRLPDGLDRRICRLAISDAGAALLAADRHRRTAWLADRVARLDPAARARLEAALDVLESLTAREPTAAGR